MKLDKNHTDAFFSGKVVNGDLSFNCIHCHYNNEGYGADYLAITSSLAAAHYFTREKREL